jgi:plasmid stabilization system protein ParE
MARGDKSKYTDKQKRKAEHIEESYEDRGVPAAEAVRRAWATVNKESGGGNKSGSGRGKTDTHVSSKGSSTKRVGKKPRVTALKPFVSRMFWLLLGAKNLA